MLVKWYQIETTTGVKKVQGLGEKFVAESLNRFGIKWDRPKAIKTPFGNYTPDFWCETAGVFIEVKGMRTALKMVGLVSLLENGRTKWAGTLDENSCKKMNWVRENIAPIDIYINDNANDAKYKPYLKDFEEKVSEFEVVYGKEHFMTWLRIDKYFHKRKEKRMNNTQEDKKEFIKILPYIEWKYNRKHGNGSWQNRPYWDAKNDSYFDMWKLNFRNGKTFEERRADRIIYKKVKSKNWNGQRQYPRLYKKFIDNTTVEYKVLKKDRWKV